MNAATARAAADPDRYWAATLPNAGAAHLAQRMLEHQGTSDEAMQALGWRADG